jgi:conjugal transfer ATP-binding protein TraC
MLEIMPQSGADDRMVEVLISLYANCPPNTGIQFHLFASPHIRRQLRQYANLRNEDRDQVAKAQVWGRPARNDNLFRKLARRRFEHLTAGAQRSLTQGFHYTIRDFRLMMSVNVQGDASSLARREQIVSLREGMGTTLRSASSSTLTCISTAKPCSPACR